MSDNLDSDALDMMLAQPALIADRGFSERVSGKLGKTISMRSKVFVAAVIGWLALTLQYPSLNVEQWRSALPQDSVFLPRLPMT